MPPTATDARGLLGAGRAILLIALLLAAIGVGIGAAPNAEEPRGPSTERRARTSRHFGMVLSDDYAWLRTAKPDTVLARPEVLEPPIRAHLDAERRYARAVLQADRRLERCSRDDPPVVHFADGNSRCFLSETDHVATDLC